MFSLYVRIWRKGFLLELDDFPIDLSKFSDVISDIWKEHTGKEGWSKLLTMKAKGKNTP